MSRRPTRVLAKSPFELETWYSSEAAKRRFGAICQAVNEQGEKVGLMGNEKRPLLILEDADSCEPSENEIEISIDEAKADWPAITMAAMLFGTRFRLRGKKVPRAVLSRHPTNDHQALKYRRTQSLDLKSVARKLEELLDEVRQIKCTIDMSPDGPLGALVSKLEKASDVIDRRFRDLWRKSQDLPTPLDYRAAH